MIYRLPESNYERVRGIFEDWQYNVRVISVIEQNTKGIIWVDSTENPRTAFVWSYYDMFTLGGCARNEGFNSELESHVDKHIIPKAKTIGLNFIAVQPYPLKEWEHIIHDLFKMRSLNTNYEYQFTFNREGYLNSPALEVPSGMSLLRIDESLLECSNTLRSKIRETWASVEKFLEKGIGFCLVCADEIICSCISRHVGGREHNIAITTYQQRYRNKGFATLTARAFIDCCLSSDGIPVWKADEHNSPSVRVAEKVHFEKIEGYPDYYFMF